MNNRVVGRKILVVEDERAVREQIARHFAAQNIVFTAASVDAAVDILRKEREIDAVILDLLLPGGSGLSLFDRCGQLPPVVILSSLDSDEQIITGLSAGANDYVAKPCSMELLETRVAIRLLPLKEAFFQFGGFSIDANLRIARFNGAPILLTSSEFNILFFLVRNSGRFFTADQIYESVWGAPSLKTTTIRSHLSFLRRKLKAAAPNLNLVQTDFGRGYAFLPPADGGRAL